MIRAATLVFTCSLAVLLLAPCARGSGLLDFETTPAGTVPADDAFLDAPYSIAGGTVRFFFDTNGNNVFDAAADALPRFEHSGGDATNAFLNNVLNTPDTARAGFAGQLGTYLLRPPVNGQLPGPFIAAYSTSFAIRELSGEIWDIDGFTGDSERWRVDVLGTTGSVLASQLSPDGSIGAGLDSLDGLPWVFQFHELPDGVGGVRISFAGSKTSQIGLAFNNFSPDVALPEPSAMTVLLIAAPLLRRCRRPAGARA